MANSAALIRESIWRDSDFRKLSRSAQCTYVQLCSQKDVDCAGLLALNIVLLVKGCDEIEPEDLLADLDELEASRFVFVDHETDEVFIRAYMRTAQVVRSPNIRKSAFKSSRLVSSAKLKGEVVSELLRLNHAEADAAADALDPDGTLRPKVTKGSRTPSLEETLSKPSSTRTVTSTRSPFVGGLVGVPARPKCSKHDEDSDENCRACMRRRKWDEKHGAAVAAQAEVERAESRKRKQELIAKAIDTCKLCDEYGDITDAKDAVRKCDHRAVGS